jgi:hypothetical protein
MRNVGYILKFGESCSIIKSGNNMKILLDFKRGNSHAGAWEQ